MAAPSLIVPVPLPFDPARLPGLSERLLRSHWENNYVAAVNHLAKTREQLETVHADTPSMLVAGLMERELTFRNSVVLHELYFGNLGGTGGPRGTVANRLSTAFGSLARFEERFRLACSGLYGASGWVIVDHDLRTHDLRLYWAGSHSQTVARGLPVLVCDLHEHSYAIDYGAAAARYVDAVWENLDWAVVERRIEQAEAFSG